MALKIITTKPPANLNMFMLHTGTDLDCGSASDRSGLGGDCGGACDGGGLGGDYGGASDRSALGGEFRGGLDENIGQLLIS